MTVSIKQFNMLIYNSILWFFTLGLEEIMGNWSFLHLIDLGLKEAEFLLKKPHSDDIHELQAQM